MGVARNGNRNPFAGAGFELIGIIDQGRRETEGRLIILVRSEYGRCH